MHKHTFVKFLSRQGSNFSGYGKVKLCQNPLEVERSKSQCKYDLIIETESAVIKLG